MKGGNSKLLFNNEKTGVTMIEMLIAAVISIVIAGSIYNLFFGQVDVAKNNSKSSQYYLSLGVFSEFLNKDLAMSKAVCPEPNGISLLINPDGILGSVTYLLKGNTIERRFHGKKKVFRFQRPNELETAFLFRVEEVKP